MQELFSFFDFGENTWMFHVFLAVLATVIFNFFLKRVIERIHRKLQATENLWDDAVLLAARRPLLLLAWVVGLSVASEIIMGGTGTDIFVDTGRVRQILIILLLALFLIKLIRNVESNVLHKKSQEELQTDEVTIKIIARLLRLSVLITTGLVILETLEFDITGVLAFGGIGGLAIGFAAQDLLANFFGGLIIFLDKPFTVGDWIRSPDREIEGTVEDIGWRVTVIRTFDKRPLYIPNSVFTKIAVENPSRMQNRRIYETFGLRYIDAGKIREIIDTVKNMLQQHDEIDTDKTLIVNFNTLAPSSLDFFVYTFTKTTDWAHYHTVKQDVLLKIIDIIHQHGADIAFPTTTLDGLPKP